MSEETPRFSLSVEMATDYGKERAFISARIDDPTDAAEVAAVISGLKGAGMKSICETMAAVCREKLMGAVDASPAQSASAPPPYRPARDVTNVGRDDRITEKQEAALDKIWAAKYHFDEMSEFCIGEGFEPGDFSQMSKRQASSLFDVIKKDDSRGQKKVGGGWKK